MKEIPYRYTNLGKQALIISFLLYFLLRFIVMVEIIVFRLKGFYENVNIPLTLVLYIAIFAVLVILLFGHRFCYTLYDDNTVIYCNRLLRREKRLDLDEAKLAVFDTFGIKFYPSTDINPKTDRPIFFLPFFRDGLITPIPINNFFVHVRDRGNIQIIKNFTVLPGYTKKWRFVAITYSFLAAVSLMNLSTPLTVVIVLFQNH